MSSLPKIVTRSLGDSVKKFEADNICAKQAKIYRMGGQMGQRSEFTEWYDVPFNSTVVDGLDLTGQFDTLTRMSVPHRVNIYASVPFQLSAPDTLDETTIRDKLDSAMDMLNARINREVANVAYRWGSQTVTRSAALSGFADISQVDAKLISQDVSGTTPKSMMLNAFDYNRMSADLAARQNLVANKTLNAYEEASVGKNAGFDTFKTSFMPSVAAQATVVTVTGAQAAIPTGYTTDANGDPTNVDNRTMNLVVSTTVGLNAGDKFTIPSINEVSMVNKSLTGNERTFTVVNIVDGTNMTIAPPIFALDASAGGTAEQQKAQADYANVDTGTSGGETINFINTDATTANVFWENEAMAVNVAPVIGDSMNIGGMEITRATTDLGFEIVIARQGDIGPMSTNWRATTFFGVTLRDPLKAGVLIGGQNNNVPA